jgi:hypothetical protein
MRAKTAKRAKDPARVRAGKKGAVTIARATLKGVRDGRGLVRTNRRTGEVTILQQKPRAAAERKAREVIERYDSGK